MKPVQFLLSVVVAGALLASCNKASFKKTPGGMPYKVFKSNDTLGIKPGNFVKVLLTQKIKDSVYFTTDNGMPLYLPVMPAQPYDLSEVWTSIHRGDSFITTQMMDTFMARNPQSVPPQFQKGDRIMTYVKVLDVFTSDSAKVADEKKGRDAFLNNEIAVVEKYLKDKNITAQKTASGAFVEVKTAGTGAKADSGKYVTVYYTGTSWSGKKFDSNTDTIGGKKPPMGFAVNTGSMIKGFDEAVGTMSVGTKARVYIPSLLGYGPQPGTPDIKPYEHLIFDIEVVGVANAAPAPPKAPAPMPQAPMPQQ